MMLQHDFVALYVKQDGGLDAIAVDVFFLRLLQSRLGDFCGGICVLQNMCHVSVTCHVRFLDTSMVDETTEELINF